MGFLQNVWSGKSCWKKGCIIYCIMAIPGLLIIYGAYKIMSGHSDERATESQDNIVTKDTLHGAPFGLSDDEEQLPWADTDYINPATGDKWGFVLGVSGDGSDPVNIAHFQGEGMQGRDMYEMRSQGSGRYVLYEVGVEKPSGITIKVSPDGNTVRVTRENVIRTGYGTEAAGTAEFKAANSNGETVNSIDPDYTPARYAIKVGDHGGKWDVLQSGETVYVFPSGEYARSQWVKDGDTFYYVDISGCRMLNNWAHDGFYAGNDGSWDKSVKCIDKNVLPQNGKAYKDNDGKTWTFLLATSVDGTIQGSARLAYPKGIDYQADYKVTSFGSSAYALHNVKDDFDCWHAVVLDGGSMLRISGAGVTEVYH